MPLSIGRLPGLLLGLALTLAGCVTTGNPAPMATATAVPEAQTTPRPADPDSVTRDAVSVLTTLASGLGQANAQERAMVGQTALFTSPSALPSPASSDGEAYPRISTTRQVADNPDGSRTVTVVHTEDAGLWRRTGTTVLTAVTPDRPQRFSYTSDYSGEYGGSTFVRTKVWQADGHLREATIAFGGSQGDAQSGPATRRTTIETKALSLSVAEETYMGTAVSAGRTLSLTLALQPAGGTITVADRLTDVTVSDTFDADGHLSPTLQVFVRGRADTVPLP